MKAMTWHRPEEKKDFPAGEWHNEPDKEQWEDESTGLPCLIVRNHSGALCGYVGVPHSHPFYGKSYGDDVIDELNVHGGITFGSKCQENKDGVCHLVEPGEDDNVWWLGFDCAHLYDLVPGMLNYGLSDRDKTYRNFSFVKAECAGLAKQVKEAV